MRRLVPLLACVLLALAASESAPTALGKGPKPSAGDNQYLDPLNSASSTSAAGAPRTGHKTTTATTSTTTMTESLSPTPAAPVTVAGSTKSATSTTAQSRTLPYTGLNVGACVALGCALLLGGFALRRLTGGAT